MSWGVAWSRVPEVRGTKYLYEHRRTSQKSWLCVFPTPRWSGSVCEESRDQKWKGIGLRQTRIDGSL